MTSIARLSLLALAVTTACGAPVAECPPATTGGETSASPEQAPPPEDSEASRICDALDFDGGTIDECAFRNDGQSLPDGERVAVLEVRVSEESGGTFHGAYLVFHVGANRQVERLSGASEDGNGGEWSELELGPLEITDDGGIAIDYTEIDVVRGCTGDPSCFDDDSNLQRTPYEHRATCYADADRFECESE